MTSLDAAAKPKAAETTRKAAANEPERLDRSVVVWLWAVAVCVFAMVVVGGATRLTQSGLSITVWKPIEGVIPPLTHADWSAAFADYRATPQFAHLFPGMTLGQFKFIFMWEWSHRLLGRVIGLVFALPLAWFWWTGRVTVSLARRLFGVLVLGGLQGVLGWLMVESGLTHRVEVAPEMLAAHLLLASTLLILLVTMATGAPRREGGIAGRLRRAAAVLPFLVLFQIGLGALVAGSRAGFVYNTWPLMDGGFAPGLAHLTIMRPLWLNWFENVALVQLDHRCMAYLLLGVVFWHAIAARRGAPGTAFARFASIVAGLVVAQACLGIVTLLLVVPLWAGLLHQAFAMVVLTAAVMHWRLGREPTRAAAPALAGRRLA